MVGGESCLLLVFPWTTVHVSLLGIPGVEVDISLGFGLAPSFSHLVVTDTSALVLMPFQGIVASTFGSAMGVDGGKIMESRSSSLSFV